MGIAKKNVFRVGENVEVDITSYPATKAALKMIADVPLLVCALLTPHATNSVVCRVSRIDGKDIEDHLGHMDKYLEIHSDYLKSSWRRKLEWV